MRLEISSRHVAECHATCPAPSTEVAPEQSENMKIRLTVGDTVKTATMSDSETTRDFLSLLPLTLTLDDYVGTEKISMLPRRLSTAGAPPGSDPSPGDIAIYAPWGNLAIYYQDAGYASGLITLGRIDDGLEAFRVPGSVVVTIERVTTASIWSRPAPRSPITCCARHPACASWRPAERRSASPARRAGGSRRSPSRSLATRPAPIACSTPRRRCCSPSGARRPRRASW